MPINTEWNCKETDKDAYTLVDDACAVGDINLASL